MNRLFSRRKFIFGAAASAAFVRLSQAQSITPQIGGGISAGFDGGLSPTSAAFLGQVATRSIIPDTKGSAQSLMTVSSHNARDDIVAMKIGLPNWYVDSTTTFDTGIGGAASYTASVQASVGATPIPFTFGGLTTGTAADFSTLISDWVNVTISKGTLFQIRNHYQNSAGCCFITFASNSLATDFAGFNATSTPDLTQSTSVSGLTASPGLAVFPILILGMTRRGNVLILGDSRSAGIFDTGNGSGDLGEVARSVGPAQGYCNASRGNAAIATLRSNGARRLELAAYFKNIVAQVGINDLEGGVRTGAQVLSDHQALAASLRKSYFLTTLPPFSPPNNVVSVHNAERINFNTSVRALPSWAKGFFEITGQVESALNSGLWTDADQAGDYKHESTLGCNIIQSSGAINTAVFG